MNRVQLIFVALLLLVSMGTARTQHRGLNGKYIISTRYALNKTFRVFDFSREGEAIKTKYFAQNAYTQYRSWKKEKNILFLCSGAFSKTRDVGSTPEGLCVENGKATNKMLNNQMDALILLYNSGEAAGDILVTDLEYEEVKINRGKGRSFDLKNWNQLDKFIKWSEKNDVTVFQTQLLYTHEKGYRTGPDDNGYKAERRMLAICEDSEKQLHHLIVETLYSGYLNKAAKDIVYLLNDMGFSKIHSLSNFDTGIKNIMKAYDKNGNILVQTPKPLNRATNLLIYYLD